MKTEKLKKKIIFVGILFLAGFLFWKIFLVESPEEIRARNLKRWAEAKERFEGENKSSKDLFKITKPIATKTLSESDTTISADAEKVSMEISPVWLSKAAKATIQNVDLRKPPKDGTLNVYDFQVDTREASQGVITLRIPYNPANIPQGMRAKDAVVGLVYNRALGRWMEESYEIDEPNHQVVIQTTHLSPHASYCVGDTYRGYQREDGISYQPISILPPSKTPNFGAFFTDYENSPFERVVTYDLKVAMANFQKNKQLAAQIQASLTNGLKAEQAFVDAGISGVGNIGSLASAPFAPMELAGYGSKLSTELSSNFQALGAGFMLLQLSSDIYYQKPFSQTGWNLFKGTVFTFGPDLVGKAFGTSATPVVGTVLAGYFLYEFTVVTFEFDNYCNDKYHQRAVNAYQRYYHSKDGYRPRAYWKRSIEEMYENAIDPDTPLAGAPNRSELFRNNVDKEFDRYVNEFFELSNEEMALRLVAVGEDESGAFYGNDARPHTGSKNMNKQHAKIYAYHLKEGYYKSTGSDLIQELKEPFKKELYEKLQSIVYAEQHRVYLSQLEYTKMMCEKLKDLLNEKIDVQFIDQSKGATDLYKGFLLVPNVRRIYTQPDLFMKWHVEMKEGRKCTSSFNLVAHIRADRFKEYLLFPPSEKENVTKGRIGNTISLPVKVDLGLIEVPLPELDIHMSFYQLEGDLNDGVYAFIGGRCIIGDSDSVKQSIEMNGKMGRATIGTYTFNKKNQTYHGDLGKKNGKFKAKINGSKINIYNQDGALFAVGRKMTEENPFQKPKPKQKPKTTSQGNEGYMMSPIFPEGDD